MKVHPAPKKRNLTLSPSPPSNQKKLRRLPHIFAKVLELPFSSDAHVIVSETPDHLRFVVPTDDDEAFHADVRARTQEIYPGVTKIVVVIGGVSFGEGVDFWRFRLPDSTRPELATAVYREGELVVTVPKGGRNDEGEGEGEGEIIGPGRLLLVQ